MYSVPDFYKKRRSEHRLLFGASIDVWMWIEINSLRKDYIEISEKSRFICNERRGGSISDEIGPVEKFNFFYIKQPHRVFEIVH